MVGHGLALVAMCLVSFFSYLTVGMLAPFLPQHLDSMGVDERWSGIIFAFYPVAVIVTTPAANAAVAKFGRPLLIGVGLLVQAVSAFIFGSFGDNLLILMLTRFTQGIGAGASNLAMFALVADLYDESIGKVMGLNELCIGAGFSAGPLFGALLFEHGGFPLPFVVCSVFLVAIAALSPALSRISADTSMKIDDPEAAKPAEDGSALSRLRAVCTRPLLAPAGLMLLGTVIWGVIDSGFYTVHAARDLSMSQTVIGLNLAAASFAYAGVGPLAGMLADRVGYGVTMYWGALVSAFTLVLLGPVGGLGSQVVAQALGLHNIEIVQGWWEFAVLLVLGAGQAMFLIPSLGAMKSAVPSGDKQATEACISLFNGFQQGGLVIGPLASSGFGAHFDLGCVAIAVTLLVYDLAVRSTLVRCGRAVAGSLLERATSPKVMLGAPGEFPTPDAAHIRSTS